MIKQYERQQKVYIKQGYLLLPATAEQATSFSLPFGVAGFLGLLLCIVAIATIFMYTSRKRQQHKRQDVIKRGTPKHEDTIPVVEMESQGPLSKGSLLKGNNNDYIIKNLLGQGTFGITYLAYVKHKASAAQSGNTLVAIKEFFMKDINGREGSTVTASGKDGIFDKYRDKFSKGSKLIHYLSHSGIVKVL